MLAQYRDGRQTEALDAYRRVREHLAQQLGLEPGPLLRALQTGILAQDPRLEADVVDWRVLMGTTHRGPEVGSPEGQATLPLPPHLDVGDVPFVGRTAELARILDAAESARRGQGKVLLLSGEPGIGKTHLAAQAAVLLQAQGWQVLYGGAGEGLGSPYAPWCQALSHLVRRRPDTSLPSPFEAVAPGEVRLGHAGTAGALVPNVLGDLLCQVAQRGPLFCVMDDLQWADVASLVAFRHVARVLRGTPALLVAVTQEAGLRPDHPVHATVVDLHRDPGIERVQLEGLTTQELTRLLDVMGLAADLESEVVSLRQRTGGNPFYAVELLRAGVEFGLRGGPVTTSGGDLPFAIRAALAHRAGRLGDAAQRLLTIAAVAGEEFDAHLVAEVAACDVEEVLDVLEAAEEAALVRCVAGRRFVFAHALIRQSLYAELLPTRRSRLHRRLADALSGDSFPQPASDVARHWLAAAPGDERAVAAAARAGEEALGAGAYEDALLWFQRALEELARARTPSAHQRAELLVSLTVASKRAGQLGWAQDAAATAADIGRRTGATALVVRAALALAGHDRLAPVVALEAHQLLREALELAAERISAYHAAQLPENAGRACRPSSGSSAPHMPTSSPFQTCGAPTHVNCCTRINCCVRRVRSSGRSMR